MDRAKILNLLESMEKRIDRMERTFAPNVSTTSNAVLHSLGALKAEIARLRSKVDVLDPSAIAHIRAAIEEIRNFSSAPDLNFRVAHGDGEFQMAGQALLDDADFLIRLTHGIVFGLRLTADDVRELLPTQKPAAFRFDLKRDEERIVVLNEPFKPAPREAELAAAALEEIVSQGEEVIDDLQRSNASHRLKNAFTRVQERLVSKSNIVQAGLSNQSAARALRGSVEELSSGQFEQLRSYVEGVSSVLAQFPEWRLFSQNSVAANLDRSAVLDLATDSLLLARQLAQSGHASKQVPSAFEQAAEWVKEGTEPDPRDVLSLSRTWENIWSVLTRNALAKALVDEGAKIVARKIIAALINTIGYGFVAILARVPGAEWMEPTFEYLKTHIQTFLGK